MKETRKIFEEEGFKAYFSEVNSPFPLSNRVFLDFVYSQENEEDGSAFAISSSKGNERIPKDIVDKLELEGKVVGFNNIVGNYFKPWKNEDGLFLGTEVFHLNNVNLEGMIPGWLVDQFGISTLIEQVATMCEFAAKEEAS